MLITKSLNKPTQPFLKGREASVVKSKLQYNIPQAQKTQTQNHKPIQ
jgi:hypothetical protein